MQFPESSVYLTKPTTECGSVLKIICCIFKHDIFQDIDEEVMTELSNEYELLLEGNSFSNLQVQVEKGYFYVHNAILEARCDVLSKISNALKRVDPNITQSIIQFLYSGKLRTSLYQTSNIIPELMQFGKSLLKSMYPFLISEYSAKTSFVGNRYSFVWEIKNFVGVRSENVFTYLITEGGTVMQVYFYPYRENGVSNFSIQVFKSRGFYIRSKVDIQANDTWVNLAEMSNSETNIYSVEVNRFNSIHRVMTHMPGCVTNGAIKLKIYVYMCSFNAKYTSNVDEISCMNVSDNRTVHMYNLREDFKRLFHHQHYHDFIIKVNYSKFCEDQDIYRSNYPGFHEDTTMFEADYSRIRTNFMTSVKCASFPVHKAILSMRSSVFRSMLLHNMKEKQTDTTEITEINPYIFYKMLLFMYCGQLSNLNVEIAIDLNYAAHRYNVMKLVKKCSEFLESNINACNVNAIRYQAVRLENHSLLAACNQIS